VSPPKAEDVIQLVMETRFLAAASRSLVLAQEAANEIRKCLDELTENRVLALSHVAIEAANAWTETARIVRKEVTNKRGHLSVFGE
jgi:hypothetical protein